MDARLMVLDSASMYFRAFHAVPSAVRAPDGMPVNAVRGFLDSIARFVSDRHPTLLIAAWDDDWRPAFRVAAIPSYKAHRLDTGPAQLAASSAATEGGNHESVPEELGPQVPIIIEALRLLGLARVGVAGYEADDVIGTIATRARVPVDVVTGDRDLFQVVDDRRDVIVLYTGAAGRVQHVNAAGVRGKYGIGPDQYADFALLRGDASDGLPGVPGIGEKTAARLLGQFGGLDAVMAAADAVVGRQTAPDAVLTARISANLVATADYVQRARRVVRLVTDLPIAPELTSGTAARLPTAPPDATALSAFARQWGIESSVARLATAFGWV